MGIYVDFMFNHAMLPFSLPPFPENTRKLCNNFQYICEFSDLLHRRNSKQHLYNNPIFHKAPDSDTEINFPIIALVKM